MAGAVAPAHLFSPAKPLPQETRRAAPPAGPPASIPVSAPRSAGRSYGNFLNEIAIL